MEINIRLSPTELMTGLRNGTLEAFLANEAQQEAKIRGGKHAADEIKTAAAEVAPVPPQADGPPAGFTPVPEPTPWTDPAPTPAPAPVADGPPQPTIDQVRAKIAPRIKAGKIVEMKALFAEFGAAKLTEVEPTSYAALIAKVAEL